MINRLPWESDRTFTQSEVTELINSNTSITVSELRYLAEGWDFVNWLVNGHWVFRIPKRIEDSDTLVQEKRLLQRLQLPISTPQFDIWIDKSDALDRPLAGYRYLAGTPLIEMPIEKCDSNKIAIQLGTVLSDLHSSDLTPPRISSDPLRLWFDDMTTLPQKCTDYLTSTELASIQAFLKTYRFRDRVGDQVTTHNDLGIEHLLVNATSTLTGIIDWADASTANRFVDLAGLWAWAGDEAIRTLLQAYPVEPNQQDLAQIRVHGLCYALEQISFGDQIGNSQLSCSAQSWVQARLSQGELENPYRAL